MKQLKINYDRISLKIGNERLFLHSGEIHHFRTAPEQWRDSLIKIKSANLNSISIYVPWNWHEPQENDLDFTGATHPQRNLLGFLEMAQEQGLFVIFRPGPFICSEWLNGGIPSWLLQKHPRILALDSQGKPSVDYGMFYPPITYSHPTYLEYVRRWYHNVLAVVQPFLYANGGNIINIQLDDEQSYWRTLEQGPLLSDYNPALIGGMGYANRYGIWLESKYQADLDRLNQAHRSDWRTFERCSPPMQPLVNFQDLPAYLDWYWFKLSEIDEYIKSLYEMVRDEGVEETISTLGHYLFSPLAWSKFTRFIRSHHLDILLTNQYYSAPLFEISDMREDKLGSIAANQEVYRAGIEGCETPPIVMEIQSAMSAHLTAPEMEELYRLVFIQGINGFNYYMMAGGENHPGYVLSNGRSYDISAPIGYQGELRSHYYTIQDLGKVVHLLGSAALETTPLYDIGVGYYEPYEACKFQANTLDLGFRDDYNFLFDEYFNYLMCKPRGFDFFTLLTHSGVSFSMINLEDAALERLIKIPQLWVLGLDFMARDVQHRLVDYVRAGGCLVLFPRIPLLDENMQSCTILAELFGCTPENPEPARRPGMPPNFRSINFDDRQGVLMFDYVDSFHPPADAEVIAKENRTGKVCAFSRHFGSGRAIMIGFKLRYVWDAHLDHKAFIHRILAEGGIERVAFSDSGELVVKERAGGGMGVLAVVNPVHIQTTTRITYTDPADGTIRTIPFLEDGITLTRQGATLMPLNLELPGTHSKLVYSTAEVFGLESVFGIDQLTLKEDKSPTIELAIQAQGILKIDADEHPTRLAFDDQTGITYVLITPLEPVVKLIIQIT